MPIIDALGRIRRDTFRAYSAAVGGEYREAVSWLLPPLRELAALAGLPPARVAKVEIALAAIESAFEGGN